MNAILPTTGAHGTERPEWIWTASAGGGRTKWNPLWARPLYLVLETTMAYVVAGLIIAASAMLPHASRLGNAALGNLVGMQLWAGFYVYVCSFVPRCSPVLQVIILMVWPLVFVYFAGPVFTAVAVRLTLGKTPLFWRTYVFEIQRDLLGFFRMPRPLLSHQTSSSSYGAVDDTKRTTPTGLRDDIVPPV